MECTFCSNVAKGTCSRCNRFVCNAHMGTMTGNPAYMCSDCLNQIHQLERDAIARKEQEKAEASQRYKERQFQERKGMYLNRLKTIHRHRWEIDEDQRIERGTVYETYKTTKRKSSPNFAAYVEDLPGYDVDKEYEKSRVVSRPDRRSYPGYTATRSEIRQAERLARSDGNFNRWWNDVYKKQETYGDWEVWPRKSRIRWD